MDEKRRILMVDDDSNIRRIAQIALSRMGPWDVFLASCGSEAMLLIETMKPEVVLLDVMMPEEDGPTVLRKIRALPGGEDIPVIFITAKVQRHEVDDLMDLGVAGIVSKPFDVKSLSSEVLSILEQWQVQESVCGDR